MYLIFSMREADVIHKQQRALKGYIIFRYILIKIISLKVYFVPSILLTSCEAAPLTDAHKKP
jgi:hypothetical protein